MADPTCGLFSCCLNTGEEASPLVQREPVLPAPSLYQNFIVSSNDYERVLLSLRKRVSDRDVEDKTLISSITYDIYRQFSTLIDKAHEVHLRLIREGEIREPQTNRGLLAVDLYLIEKAKTTLYKVMGDTLRALLYIDLNRYGQLLQVALGGKEFYNGLVPQFHFIKSDRPRRELPLLKSQLSCQRELKGRLTAWASYCSSFYQFILAKFEETNHLNRLLSVVYPHYRAVYRPGKDELEVSPEVFQIALFLFNFHFKKLRKLIMNYEQESRLTILMMRVLLGPKDAQHFDSLKADRFVLSNIKVQKRTFTLTLKKPYMLMATPQAYALEFVNEAFLRRGFVKVDGQVFPLSHAKPFKILFINFVMSHKDASLAHYNNIIASTSYKELSEKGRIDFLWISHLFCGVLDHFKENYDLEKYTQLDLFLNNFIGSLPFSEAEFSELKKAFPDFEGDLKAFLHHFFAIKMVEWIFLSNRNFENYIKNKYEETLPYSPEITSVRQIPEWSGMTYKLKTTFMKEKSRLTAFVVSSRLSIENPWSQTKKTFCSDRKIVFAPYVTDKQFLHVLRLYEPHSSLKEIKNQMRELYLDSLNRLDKWVFSARVIEDKHEEELKKLLASILLKRELLIKIEADISKEDNSFVRHLTYMRSISHSEEICRFIESTIGIVKLIYAG